jgi:6-phosphogluconolactonase
MIIERRGFLTAGAAFLTTPTRARGRRIQTGYAGCYTTGQGPKDLGAHLQADGIHAFDFDPASGAISNFRLAARCPSPTNLLVHPGGRVLYAGQGGNFAPGENGAMWYTFRITRSGLVPLNVISAGGNGPTHGMIDKRGRFLVTANFASYEVMAYRLGRDGRLLAPSARLVSASPGAPPPPPGTPLPPLPEICGTIARKPGDECRTKPHIALFSPSECWVVVAEIATDAISVYRFDARRGMLSYHSIAHGQDGGGPRHLVWSPDGRFLYSSDEHGVQVSAWRWNEAAGSAVRVQTLTTLPPEHKGRATNAHIAIHPSGRALWVSNRGSPTIACFRIDSSTGILTAAGHADTGGRDCWCFDLDATGKWLIAGNITGDFLGVYAVDPVSASLTMTAQRQPAPFPTCIRMAPLI